MVKNKELNKPEMICHFEGLLQFQKDEDFSSEKLMKLQSKFLIITSENDKGTSKTSINDLKRVYPNAKYYNFKDVEHFPMLLQPEEYSILIKNFLSN